MSRFARIDNQPLDPGVVEQAMLWMVTLQSGVSSLAEQQACQHWRNENPQHELAWQRLAGLTHDLRQGTRTLPAAGARGLLQARGTASRRNVLKGFAGLGVVLAAGLSVRERVLLPELFSDYRTTTGERHHVALSGEVELTLDTRTGVDAHADVLALNLGRVMLALGQGASLAVRTANGRVRPEPASRLVVSQGLPGVSGTQVQVLAGSASIAWAGSTRMTLSAGQQVAFGQQVGSVEPLDAGAQAWVDGLLIAERMPLGQVLAQLDRYRRGVLRCDPAVAALQVSGSFSLDRPDASLDLLASVLPIRVQRVFGYWANVVVA